MWIKAAKYGLGSSDTNKHVSDYLKATAFVKQDRNIISRKCHVLFIMNIYKALRKHVYSQLK